MNEKISRLTIIILITLLLAVSASAGWLLARSNSDNEELGRQARSHLSLLKSYGEGLAYVTEQRRVSEAGRIELDERGRRLEGEISDLIERFGYLDGGLYDVESGIGKAREGIQSDNEAVRRLVAEIRESIEAVEGLQDRDVLPGGGVDPDDSSDGGA